MKESMDHARVSEMLGGFVRDELSERDREAVAEHLASCSDCAAEQKALEQILAVEVDPLDEEERRALRSGVSARLQSGPISLPARRESRNRLGRFAPALAAVAIVALGAVFAASLLTGGSGDEGAGGGGVAQDQAEKGAVEAPAAVPGPGPTYDAKHRKLTNKALRRLGSRKGVLADLAGRFTTPTTEGESGSYTDALGAQAPPEVKDQVKACAETVTGNQKSAVPAYATSGSYKGKDALLIGFVTGNDGGPLNRYMLWLWPQGSCDTPLDYRSGAIEK